VLLGKHSAISLKNYIVLRKNEKLNVVLNKAINPARPLFTDVLEELGALLGTTR